MTTTTTTTSRHCEMCGATNPQVIDSYTACCNERVCDGGWPQTWVLGSDYDIWLVVTAALSGLAILIVARSLYRSGRVRTLLRS